MNKLWLEFTTRIEALNERERVLVLVAGVLVAAALVFFITADPAQRRSRTLVLQMKTQKDELAMLQKAGGPQQVDPDAANRARAEALKTQIRVADETLRTLQRDLVPAEQVNTLLREMLVRDSRLSLVSLRTLPVEPLVGGPEGKAAAAKDSAETVRVYKHGVEITLQGTYTSLHDYVARLEKTPWRMYWSRAQLKAADDAKLTLIVTVYTLSLDKAWLRV